MAGRGGRHRGVDRHAAARRCSPRPGSRADAVDVVFTGADHGVERGVEQDYQRGLPAGRRAARPEVLLAYEMNGAPLPPQHGAPAAAGRPRLVRHGAREVAARRSTSSHRAVHGFQNAVAYRLRRRRRRARRAGHPDRAAGAARAARLPRLHVPHARAAARAGARWRGGPGPATRRSSRVEVSTDGGASWRPAELDGRSAASGPGGAGATRGRPRPGGHVLGARATDAAGRSQPVEQPWNRGGFANNLVQRVEVVVLSGEPERADGDAGWTTAARRWGRRRARTPGGGSAGRAAERRVSRRSRCRRAARCRASPAPRR